MSTATDHLAELPVSEGVWQIDRQRSEVGFAVKAMYGLQTVRGVFGAYDGTLTVAGGGATGELTIDAASLDTGNERRDRHLRSADFFDAERYPRIVFATTAVSPRERGLTLNGALRIGSACLRVEIPVDVVRTGDGAIRLDGGTTISRAAVGIDWNWLGTIHDVTQLRARLTLTRTAA